MLRLTVKAKVVNWYHAILCCRDIRDKKGNNGDISDDDKVKVLNNNFEELPPIVNEGKDFRNELPDRLYLDSDPEFHLNLHIVLSYLLLFHVDSHILTVVRRLVVLYFVWMLIGIEVFIYMTYYPILLDEPILKYQFSKVVHPIYKE